MAEKKFTSVDFGKMFRGVNSPVQRKCEEFEFKDFGDYLVFGVKEKRDKK